MNSGNANGRMGEVVADEKDFKREGSGGEAGLQAYSVAGGDEGRRMLDRLGRSQGSVRADGVETDEGAQEAASAEDRAVGLAVAKTHDGRGEQLTPHGERSSVSWTRGAVVEASAEESECGTAEPTTVSPAIAAAGPTRELGVAPLDFALDYAELGLQVFPCCPGGKTPLTAHGFKNATRDPQLIRSWWSAQPDANVAMATGPMSGNIVVIDLDLKGAVDGVAAWEKLIQGREVPTTLTQQTPSGGRHIFFTVPEGTSIRNSAGKLAPGIDVRGEGGYIVLAPSTAPAGQYTLGELVYPAPMPDWLLTLLEQKQAPRNTAVSMASAPSGATTVYGSSALENEAASVADAPEGQRNETLNGAAFAAGQLVGGGEIAEDEAKAKLHEAGIKCGLDADEVDRTIASGIAGGKKQPRSSWPPLRSLDEPGQLPKFPVTALPRMFQDHAAAVAESFQVPVDLPAVCTLGAAAIAATKRFRVRLGPHHFEPSNIYVCALHPPGDRKTAVFDAMFAPVWQVNRERNDAAKPQIERAKEEAKLAKDRAKRLRDEAAKEAKEAERRRLMEEADRIIRGIVEPEEPPTMCTGADATPESLAILCAKNQGRIAQIDGEGGALFRMCSAYQKGPVEPQIEFLLRAHAGDHYASARVGRPSIDIDDPALTLVLACQPDVFRAMPHKRLFRERGLLGRFLPSMPRSLVGHRSVCTRGAEIATMAEYKQSIRDLLAIPPASGTADNPYRGCRILTLEDEARDHWEAFARRIEAEQAVGGALCYERDFASKLAGAVGRIAGLLCVLAHAEQACTISGHTMQGAIAIGEYFLRHWLAVIVMSGFDRQDEVARRVLDWIRRHEAKEVTSAGLWRDLRNGLNDRDELTNPLEDLVDRGYLCPKTSGKTTRRHGRPPSEGFLVRPGLFSCI